MWVENLELENFRNIQKSSIAFDKGVNVIWGDNAQGKTNLLEAVWLFTGARSFRGAGDRDILQFCKESSRLELAFHGKSRRQTARIAMADGKKAAFLNDIRLEHVSRLSGEFLAVVFSPDHLSLIKDGPEKRRRLADTGLCQAYPKYLSLLEGYGRILRQRNALLKDAVRHPQLLDMLDVWDQELCRAAGYMMFTRQRYVSSLACEASEIYSGISSGTERISISYNSSIGPVEGMKAEEIRQKLSKALTDSRVEDIRLAQTQKGPHRDDLDIRINETSARSFGSQGQQRSCVLAIKLAECAILQRSTGSRPVVLLDDVMSELDSGRRDFLLNHLTNQQVFITCCDKSYLKDLNGGGSFHIIDGSIKGD